MENSREPRKQQQLFYSHRTEDSGHRQPPHGLGNQSEDNPRMGETVLGHEFKTSTGVKRVNQAVAAAKLGADVTLVGRVGADSFGEALIQNAKQLGITLIS